MKKETKDCTEYGIVDDRDGDWIEEPESNLGRLLCGLKEEEEENGKEFPKSTKIKVLQSRISYRKPDNPERYDVEIVRTYGHLKRLYKSTAGKDFNAEKFHEEARFRLEMLKKQGDKNSAFGVYSYLVNKRNQLKESATILRNNGRAREAEMLEAM